MKDMLQRKLEVGQIVVKMTKKSGAEIRMVVGFTAKRVLLSDQMSSYERLRGREYNFDRFIDGCGRMTDPYSTLIVVTTVEEPEPNTFIFRDPLTSDVAPFKVYAGPTLGELIRANRGI